MWAVAGRPHGTDMRTKLLPKSLAAGAAAATLGVVVALGGLGAQNATAAQTSTTDDAEARFLELASLIAQGCAPDESGLGTAAAAADPVPLDPAEQCAGERHQLRVGKAFLGTDTATYEALRDKLTTLRYPAARIHRMPDLTDDPVARLDLRVGAGHLALQVTDVDRGVIVQVFGVPDGVAVTDVRLAPPVDRPTT